jgi:hypothetical protein
MLKPAQEMNQVAHEACASAMDAERRQQDERARKAAERDRNHAEFQRRAFLEAKDGSSYLVMTDLRLSRTRLLEQGFELAELTRRERFQASLEQSIQELETQIPELAQQLMQECPEVPDVLGDTFVHRNPWVSLLKTLQNSDPAVPWADVEFFKQYMRFSTQQGMHWLEANTRKIQSFLQMEDRLRLARIKFHSVARDNQLIPPGHETAVYVGWADADLNLPWETQFSARYLRWVSRSWRSMITLLSNELEDRAAQGAFDARIRLVFVGGGWFAYQLGIDQYDAFDEFVGADDNFGPPSFWASELKQLGYRITIKHVIGYKRDADAETAAVDPHRLAKPVVQDCYQLEIAWD